MRLREGKGVVVYLEKRNILKQYKKKEQLFIKSLTISDSS